MSNKLYSEESIQAIANSIRAKNGKSETYTVSEMSTAINELPTNLTTKTITENGTYSASSDNADGYSEVTVAVEGYAKKLIENTPTAIATFNAAALPMPSLKIGIEAVQAGNGDPSPTNVRPISGWSAVNVYDEDMIGLEIVDSWLTSIGEAHSVDGDTLTINYITLKPYDNPCTLFNDDRTVTISVDSITGVATGVKLQLIDANNTFVGQVTNSSKTFTGVGSKIRIDYGGGGRSIIKGLQIYSNGQTYTTTLKDGQGNPMVCYGGTLDVVSGVLTVDKGFVDLGTLTWTNGGAMQMFFSADIRDLVAKPSSNDEIANVLSDRFEATSYNELSLSTIGKVCISTIGSIGIVDGNTYESVTDFKTAMNGVQLVYELATPTTIQLTPTAVKSLLGTNNIWADSGDVIRGEYFVEL